MTRTAPEERLIPVDERVRELASELHAEVADAAARHDTARRSDAAFLARLVVEESVSLPTGRRVACDLVDAIPREGFTL